MERAGNALGATESDLGLSYMRTALICEQWKVPIAANGGSGLPWFLDWVERSPKGVSDHTACGYWCYSTLANKMMEFSSVSEYFGGAGFQSTIIRNLFNVREHNIADISAKSCEHLFRLFANQGHPATTNVKCVDSIKNPLPNSDLVTFDCGELTALTLTRHIGEAISRITRQNPKALVITDIAGPHLHLQRKRYSEILWNDCADYPTYLHGLAEYIRRVFHYDALCIYYTRWSAVMALLPKEQITKTAMPQIVPESPVGFKWLQC